MFCRATYHISKEFKFIVDFFNEEKLLAAAGGTILYYRFIEKKREKTSPFSIYFNLLGYLTSEIGKLKKAKFIVYLLLSFFHISFSSGLRVSIL